MNKRLAVALLSTAALSACVTAPMDTASVPPQTVSVQILAINDFHGNLETPQRATSFTQDGESRSVPLGGAAELAATLASLRREDSLTVAAGDLVGASPLISSLFLDEPTIAALSAMELDVASVGNHEFDRGIAELRRIQEGGCEQHTRREPCAIEPFLGARFNYLAANVVDATGETLFPGSEMHEIGGAQIGFIGMTLEGTPSLVAAQATEGYTFLDEAETANRHAASLRADGADAIVLLIHEGANVDPDFNISGCPGLSGPIVQIIGALDPSISLVVSGHTHQAYVCNVPNSAGGETLLTSGGRFGGFVTDIAMTIDPVAGEVIALSGRNVPVDGSAGSEPQLVTYVETYANAAGPFSDRIVGPITDTGELGEDCGDRPADDFVADAYFFMAEQNLEEPADFALVNSGGVRTDLSGAADGLLSFGELYEMAPFTNGVVVLDMTGAQVLSVLEQQFCEENGTARICDSILIPSAEMQFTADLTAPSGQRITSVTVNGEAIDPQRHYRVATNSFLAGGQDGFTVFGEAAELANAGFDLDGIEAYVAQGNLTIPVCGRVRGFAPVD